MLRVCTSLVQPDSISGKSLVKCYTSSCPQRKMLTSCKRDVTKDNTTACAHGCFFWRAICISHSILFEAFSPMARRVTMQRSQVCLYCGLNIVDINSKHRRVLLKATNLVPSWEEVLRIKLYELDPDATLSRSTLLSILRPDNDSNHGMCKKCFNSYTGYHKCRLSLLENIMKVLNNGALSEAITFSKGNNDAAKNTARREAGHIYMNCPPQRSYA